METRVEPSYGKRIRRRSTDSFKTHGEKEAPQLCKRDHMALRYGSAVTGTSPRRCLMYRLRAPMVSKRPRRRRIFQLALKRNSCVSLRSICLLTACPHVSTGPPFNVTQVNCMATTWGPIGSCVDFMLSKGSRCLTADGLSVASASAYEEVCHFAHWSESLCLALIGLACSYSRSSQMT